MSRTNKSSLPQPIRDALEQILDYAMSAEEADYEAAHYRAIPKGKRQGHIYEAFLTVRKWLRRSTFDVGATANAEQLLAQGYVAAYWHIDDVHEVRPDLTDEQCRRVLLEIDRNHDADIGISWDVLRCQADDLFPEPREAAQ